MIFGSGSGISPGLLQNRAGLSRGNEMVNCLSHFDSKMLAAFLLLSFADTSASATDTPVFLIMR